MAAITTHVLDTARGCPAAHITVRLEVESPKQANITGDDESRWKRLAQGTTDADGRLSNLWPPDTPLAAGNYRLTFETGEYFRDLELPVFYPEVRVTFRVEDDSERYHVPLLLSPYGYSTYRGS